MSYGVLLREVWRQNKKVSDFLLCLKIDVGNSGLVLHARSASRRVIVCAVRYSDTKLFRLSLDALAPYLHLLGTFTFLALNQSQTP